MVLEMDIVSSRYYAYVNGTYDVQQIELSHFYNNQIEDDSNIHVHIVLTKEGLNSNAMVICEKYF